MSSSSSAKMVIALAAVYIIWGSTYLAIRYAIDTIPPLLMAGVRFVIAGAALYLWARWRGEATPSKEHWRGATVVGGLLFLGGNGAVVWAEQVVPSGLTALLVSTVPLWMVVIDSMHRDGYRLTRRNVLGLLFGFVGVGFLITPGSLLGSEHVNLLGAGILLLGSLSWSIGSLYSRRAVFPKSLVLISGMQMLSGGLLLIAVGLLMGEANGFDAGRVSGLSLASMMYLILFGSIVGFTAYTWLLTHTTPARAATYAYVNPLVAVILGWAIGGEPLGLRTILGAAVIITAVVVIITRRSTPQPPLRLRPEQPVEAVKPDLRAAAE
jgi:drug/metabolite transporter (DMT)-like permease